MTNLPRQANSNMKPLFSTADLSDAEPTCSSCEILFKQYGGRREFFGKIRTVKCMDDNILLRRTLETRASGEVLVVDGGGYVGSALIGDMIAGIGIKNGWSGVLIYGGVRDIVALGNLDFGVKALGSNPRKGGQNGMGEVDVVLSFGGATFIPGHWIYSDDDGVLLSPERLPGV
jgi:regulator of ribonuclease activity A